MLSKHKHRRVGPTRKTATFTGLDVDAGCCKLPFRRVRLISPPPLPVLRIFKSRTFKLRPLDRARCQHYLGFSNSSTHQTNGIRPQHPSISRSTSSSCARNVMQVCKKDTQRAYALKTIHQAHLQQTGGSVTSRSARRWR